MAEHHGAENADIHTAKTTFEDAYATNDVEKYFSFVVYQSHISLYKYLYCFRDARNEDNCRNIGATSVYEFHIDRIV